MFVRALAMTAVGLAMVSTSAFAAGERPHGINAREQRQVARIRQGVAGRDLTRGEIDKLRADEAAVRAEERVFRSSGDGLNRREYLSLQRDLRQTSREIYRAKHNQRVPLPRIAE